ncbi:Pyrimidine reductase, riboflavin biosynthesis [Nocardioides scoriae]|uniref:Pyrimidine reductase, riboflavin biosynthesis n=1 Tax=Nocardioides scoriae TaxID=642780 RepID=A0A1H1V2F1_9ACTN|nr:dihydrofolate reductase family protein [Nocardioides scoriae]SDS78853.1 Pyrimidine reductase, riboflavin biosynthesis [Nocardioides scoriae]
MEIIYGPQRGPVASTDLPDHYPWPERAGQAYVRAMMVATLDGAAAGGDGLSGSITGDADGEVFTAVRRFADAVLVGGGTLKAEEYGPLHSTDDDAKRRVAAGQADAPVIVVVSGSLTLPLGDDGFTGSTLTPLVFTTADPDPERLAQVRERCEVVQAEGDTVEVSWVIDRLVERGLWRIVCEGGPTLLRDAAASGRLDEADLTFSPMLVGTEKTPPTDMLADPRGFELVHVIAADDFLMSRYVRRDNA